MSRATRTPPERRLRVRFVLRRPVAGDRLDVDLWVAAMTDPRSGKPREGRCESCMHWSPDRADEDSQVWGVCLLVGRGRAPFAVRDGDHKHAIPPGLETRASFGCVAWQGEA